MVLQDRCDLTGGAGGLRRAADLLWEVRDHPAETDVVAASVELAACLLALDAAGQPGLDEAIEVLKAAAPSAGLTTAAVAAERAYALGVALAARFGRGGDADDARDELKAVREAVALSAADGQGADARYRDGLGSAYLDQWRLTRDPALLGSALAEYGLALDSGPGVRESLRIQVTALLPPAHPGKALTTDPADAGQHPEHPLPPTRASLQQRVTTPGMPRTDSTRRTPIIC